MASSTTVDSTATASSSISASTARASSTLSSVLSSLSSSISSSNSALDASSSSSSSAITSTLATVSSTPISSTAAAQANPASSVAAGGLQGQTSPPYAPTEQSLGGTPSIIPDVPICAIFLCLYLAFAIIHMSIMKKNQKRGHKFVFSGAMFGFCSIRVVTMSLRIAWANHARSIPLGIAAQIFVYVGTVIIFIMNWFFVQRVVRAQHPRWGWSTPYRILHRASLVGLIICLLLLIVAGVQQFYTLDPHTLRIDHDFQLTGLTYFMAFSFAPVVLVLISLALPRKGTEKFGAGRLRNNITILLLSAAILTLGTAFRAGTAYLDPVPLRDSYHPWYYSKACFYGFNFVTEIIVVMFYALVRFDLRFHIPDGAKGPGSYSKGDHHIGVIGNEKNLKRMSGAPLAMHQANTSTATIETYGSSLFDDSRTLAESLRHPSSTLELDQKTGNWKVKRQSRASSISGASTRYSQAHAPSLWSPDGDIDPPPPVPDVPADWPLRESQLAGSNQHPGSNTRGSNELPGHEMNNTDLSVHSIADAIAALNYNSASSRRHRDILLDRSADSTPVSMGDSTRAVVGTGAVNMSPRKLQKDRRRTTHNAVAMRKSILKRNETSDTLGSDQSWKAGDDSATNRLSGGGSKHRSAPMALTSHPLSASIQDKARTPESSSGQSDLESQGSHHCKGCKCHGAWNSSEENSVINHGVTDVGHEADVDSEISSGSVRDRERTYDALEKSKERKGQGSDVDSLG